MYSWAIAITVISNVLYHVFQKLTPSTVNPILALFSTYVAAALFCLLLLPLFPVQTSLAQALGRLNFASLGLALAVVGLEVGFLLAYRHGWRISAAALISNTSVSLLLIPVGLAFFRERPSTVNAAGILICLVGLVMVNWKTAP